MKTILVIDDRETIGGSTVELLEVFGLRTWLVPVGSIGLGFIQEKSPDLVFCTDQLPEPDGYELLRSLRLDTRFDQVPFYFMTDRAIPDEQRKGASLGATGYLISPFSQEELLNCICKHIVLPTTWFTADKPGENPLAE